MKVAYHLSILLVLPLLARASDSSLTALPQSAQSQISASLGRDLAVYHLSSANGIVTGDNPAQQLSARFTSQGVEFISGSLRWNMALRAYGYGEALHPVAPCAPRAEANRIEYRRGSFTEWYVNGPAGVEQGYTIQHPPGKSEGQFLVFQFGVSEELTARPARDGTSLDLTDRRGNAVLRYHGLTAVDAAGKQLRASMEITSGQMRLRINDSGALYPLTIDPWVQSAKLTASDGAQYDSFGAVVAIGGETVVVGAPNVTINGAQQVGAVYVFIKPSSGWRDMTQTAKLTASDGVAQDQFGTAVDISGNTIIVGVPNAARNGGFLAGAAYVFVKPTNGWKDMTETAEITATTEGPGSYFGNSVAVSGDIAVASGVNGGGSGVGQLYLFLKPKDGWKNMTESFNLHSSNGNVGGPSIDGDTIVGGSAFFQNWKGAAYVYVMPKGGWQDMTETAILTASDGKAGDDFGWSVVLKANTLFVGAVQGVDVHGSCKCGPGKVYVFGKPSRGWVTGMKFRAKLTAAGTRAGFYFGNSVASNGKTVSVGSWPAGETSQTEGLAYVFQQPKTGWKTTSHPVATLAPSDPVKYDNFGLSVAISGNTIVSGAVGAVVGNKVTGAAYVFGK